MMMPVFATAAGGGVVVDVDGNSLIDLGSGTAVTGVGNADPAVAAAVADQVVRFTHTCFMITGYEGYIEVMDAFEHGGLLERARRIEGIVTSRLRAAQQSDPRIGDIRGRGAMVALELADPSTGDPDAALTTRVAQRTQGDGVIVLSRGAYGNVIRLLPPLTIPDDLLAEGLDVLLSALARS